MARTYRIAVIGGDGIGPEVTDAALSVLDAAEARFGFKTERTPFDWSALGYTKGLHVTAEMIEPLKKYDAVLLGAIGHPDAPRGLPEMDIVFGLRRGLDLFVNLRPLVLYDERLCPLKGRTAADVDMVVVRENTEDVYGVPGRTEGAGGPDETVATEMRFTRRGTERITRYAFELARSRPRKRLTMVDKANAIRIQDLHRRVFEDVAKDFPDVERDAMYVDAASMWMVLHPERFDVIVTTNLFGDILSDLGAAICGGLGSGASGNIHPGRVSVFEPIHGSAPKHAGKNTACPLGAVLAVSMMLDHLGETKAAEKLERAVAEVIAEGKDVTYDFKADRNDPTAVGTQEMAEAICKKMK